MIEKNERCPSDIIVQWSRLEVPSLKYLVVQKIWDDQVPKRVRPNINLI